MTLAAPAILASPRRAWSRLDPQLAAFLNWLACWIVLPNLPFLPVTLMGGPPRLYDYMACGIAGLVARRFPFPAKVAIYLCLMTYLVLGFIASMFNMGLGMIMSVALLVFDMSPATSMEYVAGGVLLVICIGLALWLMRQPGTFDRPRYVLTGVLVTLALAGADYALSRDTIGAYSRLAPEGAPFSSATGQTQLLSHADGQTNLMVVMVEAMGQPVDPVMRERLAEIWTRPELAERFDITYGQTPFYGSTTSGEIRELCGRWGNYDEIREAQPGCLPAQLAGLGYATTAVHGFQASFFERDRWYPLLGFEEALFGDDLMRAGTAPCPNVFPGPCDRDIPDLIGEQLVSADKPQFVYWLTLNSHLPIVENRELGTEECAQLGAERDSDFPMICRLFAIWEDSADALVRLATRPDLPPTHILIVGDHMPPFTHQASRLQFDAENVPWVLLRYRGPESAE
jgi:hypothetical protein